MCLLCMCERVCVLCVCVRIYVGERVLVCVKHDVSTFAEGRRERGLIL